MVITQSAKFDDVSISIFKCLIESFPVAKDIDASVAGFDIIGGTSSDPENPDGNWGTAVNPPTADEVFFASCVRWLGNEGYLSFAHDYGNGFSNVVLTHKGLSLLRVKPRSLDTENYR